MVCLKAVPEVCHPARARRFLLPGDGPLQVAGINRGKALGLVWPKRVSAEPILPEKPDPT